MSQFPEIDKKLSILRENQVKWLQTSFREKCNILEQIITNIKANQEEWISVALRERKLDSTEIGEEIGGGVMPTIRLCKLLLGVYKPAALAEKEGKPVTGTTFPQPSVYSGYMGRKIAQVFPVDFMEKALFAGVTAETWIQEGKKPTQATELLDAIKAGVGKVSLVLGAGNQSSILFMDALYKLYNQGQVVMLKHNPVNDYLEPIVAKVFAPLIKRGFFQQTKGGVDEGKYLVEQCDNIHITGSDKTHDVIVYGSRDKATEEPQLQKEITSELGCVSPVIVVPGPWSDAELDYHVQTILGATFQNASFNCNAAKMLVTHKNWHLRDKLLQKLREGFAAQKTRYAYYPGAKKRYDGFMEKYDQAEKCGNTESLPEGHLNWALIPNIDENDDYAMSTEPFCGLLSECPLDAAGPDDFLRKATAFCNDKLWGNLSATILIHPHTSKKYVSAFEDTVAELKYGSIGVNVWSALSYALGSTVWGAFPGNEMKDIQSGRGFVHNTFMLDHPEKSVVRAPFVLLMGAKMVYFPNFKNLAPTYKALVEFEGSPSWMSAAYTLWNMLWG